MSSWRQQSQHRTRRPRSIRFQRSTCSQGPANAGVRVTTPNFTRRRRWKSYVRVGSVGRNGITGAVRGHGDISCQGIECGRCPDSVGDTRQGGPRDTLSGVLIRVTISSALLNGVRVGDGDACNGWRGQGGRGRRQDCRINPRLASNSRRAYVRSTTHRTKVALVIGIGSITSLLHTRS